MPVETALPENHPIMLAWNEYKLTDGFENTKKWAMYEDHVEGSLWTAFVAGYNAKRKSR